MKSLLITTAALFAALISHAATPVDDLVAKARAALGDETALSSVKSLRIEMSAADGEGKALGSVISEYKAPMKQREIDYTFANLEVITAIDGREGHRVLHRLDNNARQLQILPSEEVNARRDFVTSNLYLLATPNAERGSVAINGTETIDGVACEALDYKYKSGITVRRLVNKATGKLVGTRINQNAKTGDLMVNVGEQKIAGIAYPKSIVIRDKDGKTLRTLTVNKVEVNPEIADSGFITPLF
jgi:hypothetical protein